MATSTMLSNRSPASTGKVVMGISREGGGEAGDRVGHFKGSGACRNVIPISSAQCAPPSKIVVMGLT